MITNNVELNEPANFSLTHSLACVLIICTLLSFIVHNARSNQHLKLLLNIQCRLPCSLLREKGDSATTLWWLKCLVGRSRTEGLCAMLSSHYLSLLPAYIITASVAAALLGGKLESCHTLWAKYSTHTLGIYQTVGWQRGMRDV